MAKLQASEARRADPGVVLAAVRQDGLALEHAAWALRNDPAVCRAAVEASGGALERCTPTVRADRAVVLAAVRQVRKGARGRADKEQGAGATAPLDGSAAATLVWQLSHRCPGPWVYSYSFMVARFSLSLFFFGTGGGQAGWALRFASAELRANREVALAACAQHGNALEHVAKPLQVRREMEPWASCWSAGESWGARSLFPRGARAH